MRPSEAAMSSMSPSLTSRGSMLEMRKRHAGSPGSWMSTVSASSWRSRPSRRSGTGRPAGAGAGTGRAAGASAGVGADVPAAAAAISPVADGDPAAAGPSAIQRYDPKLMPVSTISRTPARASATHSARTSSAFRLVARPRATCTMQYVQALLQPSCTLTPTRVWKPSPTASTCAPCPSGPTSRSSS